MTAGVGPVWLVGWGCPKFHILEYNYSVCAGQWLAVLGFVLATFDNSKILDIGPRKAWKAARFQAGRG